MILTIRTVYRESFHNLLLNGVKVQQYHVELISNNNLLELSNKHGFRLPSDKRLKQLLCAPFYLNLYLALDNVDDEERIALNREAFEEKVWEDIVRNNKKRKNNMPTRREQALLFITMEMLQHESYLYEIQSSDDYEAFAGLEQTGILIRRMMLENTIIVMMYLRSWLLTIFLQINIKRILKRISFLQSFGLLFELENCSGNGCQTLQAEKNIRILFLRFLMIKMSIGYGKMKFC